MMMTFKKLQFLLIFGFFFKHAEKPEIRGRVRYVVEQNQCSQMISSRIRRLIGGCRKQIKMHVECVC